MKTSSKYIQFEFDYMWIRDKQIIHKGNEYYGMLIILDDEGRMVKMYGYELIEDNEEQI